ncbi:MAG: NACHT domain-containing protein [Bacteroidota bacterium]|nr:NACHT domain-containing protein [Bacteroidota bacterium]
MKEKASTPFDSAAKAFETVTQEGAKSLFQLVWSLTTAYGKKIVDKVKIADALEKYSANFIRRHGEVKVLNMSSPIPLTQIYTKVRLVHTRAEQISNIEEHELRFWKRAEYYVHHQELEATEVVYKHDRLNVLGAPGAGKSTLLKRVGLYFLAENQSEIFGLEHTFLPILLELKQFNGNTTIRQAIEHEFEIAGFPESSGFVERALKDGKLMILLDGLDEVPRSTLDSIITSIRDLTHQYPLNRYVTSCRTAYYKNFLKGFSDIEIANFNEQQVRTFISNWFNSERDVTTGAAERLSSLLFDPINIATLELARTPLLLTFLCIVYDAGQQFPANRSSLYRRALDILLERWSAEKRIHNEDIYQNLNSDLEIQMLSDIAAYFYNKDKTLFYADELKEQITKFVENTMGVSLPPASKILEAIEIQQGLLVERMIDVYSFSHLTIQEYLTAFYYHSPVRMPLFIEKHCFDRKWREVFILQAGMSHSEDMLLLFSRFLKSYSAKNLILQEGVKWVNKVARSDNSPEGVCKRIMLLSFLIRYRRKEVSGEFELNSIGARVKDFNEIVAPEYYAEFTSFPKHSGKQSAPRILEALTELTEKKQKSVSILREIEALTPSRPLNTMLPGSKLSFNKQVLTIILKGFDVPEHFTKPRVHTFNIIENYLEGLALLAECKTSALRVSPAVWSEILASIIR